MSDTAVTGEFVLKEHCGRFQHIHITIIIVVQQDSFHLLLVTFTYTTKLHGNNGMHQGSDGLWIVQRASLWVVDKFRFIVQTFLMVFGVNLC